MTFDYTTSSGETDVATGSRYHAAAITAPSFGSARSPRAVFDQQQDLLLPRRGAANNVASEFRKHAKKWKRETFHLSSPTDKYLHPSYARVIGLGRDVIPHILRELVTSPDDWFYALRAISGENPVTASAAGDMHKMTALWMAWGKARGIV
jgi:hypothetical protein